MDIILHAGAHFTEEERLFKCLLRNHSELAERGTSVPAANRYRRLLRDTINAMSPGLTTQNTRDLILDAVLDHEMSDRLLLSNAHFFGSPRTSIDVGLIYPKATIKLQRLTEIFEQDRVELFLGLRNPATFIPAIASVTPDMQLGDFLSHASVYDVRWSELLTRIRQDLPDIKITVWCNEDAPLIWAQIIREIAGFGDNEKVIGGFDLLSDIMSNEGMQRFRSYLGSHPDMNEIQKRRVILAFLEKFVLEDAIEEELDLEGWSEPLIAELTTRYDADIEIIRNIPGVHMITP